MTQASGAKYPPGLVAPSPPRGILVDPRRVRVLIPRKYFPVYDIAKCSGHPAGCGTIAGYAARNRRLSAQWQVPGAAMNFPPACAAMRLKFDASAARLVRAYLDANWKGSACKIVDPVSKGTLEVFFGYEDTQASYDAEVQKVTTLLAESSTLLKLAQTSMPGFGVLAREAVDSCRMW